MKQEASHRTLSVALTLALLGALLFMPIAAANRMPQAISLSSHAARERNSAAISRLEQRLPALMSDAEIPGLSIGVVERGALVWSKGFGLSNAETKTPVTDDTVFEAASLSKPVFAYAVLKLVDSGKFDLNKPLTEYLPGPYDVGDDPRLLKITARHVLTHTTGFPNWRSGAQLKIHFTPGERFSYSGEGFVYLAKVIEKVTGESFNDFMKRMVFVPLGMPHSSYIWESRYETQKTFRHNAFGRVGTQGRLSVPNAAASLNTTAADYGRFLAAVLNGTGLRKETSKLMKTPQIQVGERSNSIDRPPSKLSETISWGLGVGLEKTAEGISFWHWGDNGDGKAYVVASEKSRNGVVVFMNSAHGLSILPELIEQSIGGVHPAITWLNYERYRSPARILLRNIQLKGAEQAIADYREWRKSRPREQQLTEGQINRLGYNVLFGLNKPEEAIVVFKLNVEDYPQSSNTYDSLAEGYMVAGKDQLAIENYEKSIALDPNNTEGRAKLEALKKKMK